GLQDWVKLNNAPIIPGISMKRDFSGLGANKSEENLLKARLFKLLTSHKLKETDNNYLQKLNNNEKELDDIMKLISDDYEIALIHGFAFLDHSIRQKTDYQYGLFIAGTAKLLAKVSWNYGQIPDLNAVNEITSRANTKNKGVLIIWNADL